VCGKQTLPLLILGKSRMRKRARTDLCGGRSVMVVPTATELEARRALISLTRLGWGHHNPAFCRMFTNRFMPNATPVHENWFDDLQRMSTSAENAARLMEVDSNIDIRRFLRQVQVPTLVVHCDRDQVVSSEHGRQLAAGIPDARYASLPSANHLLLAEEKAWQILLQEFSAFMGWHEESSTPIKEASAS